MGRGTSSSAQETAALRLSDVSVLEAPPVPWREPNDFYALEAEMFATADEGLALDPTVAHRLLRLPIEADSFAPFRDWYRPLPRHLIAPADTCPQISEAGEALAAAIAAGETLAVFCDYDVDGLAAGESLRRALAPYEAKLHFGYADASTGFGLTDEFVRQAAAAGSSYLITLDCGTGQPAQVALAQELGLKVIVVDHHGSDLSEENPADFHLNPNRPRLARIDGEQLTILDGDQQARLLEQGVVTLDQETDHADIRGADGARYQRLASTSANTGAQLAWKLGAAVQIAREGKTRDEHWRSALHLAGMGCLADRASVLLQENRAFFWLASDQAPVGVRVLAARLGEQADLPGGAIQTQACLNLAKRTAKVKTEQIAALLAAETVEEATPIAESLAALYEQAKPIRKQMVAQVLAETGKASSEGGTLTRPQPEKLVAVAVLDDSFSEWVGYTGPVASTIASRTKKPALIFCPRGEDEFGQQLVKFSIRNDGSVRHPIGELLESAELKSACEISQRDEHGATVQEAALGGHLQAVSGVCHQEKIAEVSAAVEAWAAAKESGRGGLYYDNSNRYGANAVFVSARLVSPDKLPEIEEQARRLGPFSHDKQAVSFSASEGRLLGEARNKELEVTVAGALKELRPDPESDGSYLKGTLVLDDGSERPIICSTVEPAAEGARLEWLLRLGRAGDLFLSKHSLLA